jgi:SAM-dependent methyltransferase
MVCEMSSGERYDSMGRGYRDVRRPDPRIAAMIWAALDDAASVANVGAGTGSYEPDDRDVIAIEPASVMIAQRAADAAPVLQAAAEALPLATRSVDAAMAVLTLQHWADVERGLSELQRVARKRVVVVTMDVDVLAKLWLISDYVPEMLGMHAAAFPSISRLSTLLQGAKVRPIPVPRDCTDGFMAAFWGRPEAYLDPAVRAGSSPWHQLPPPVVERVVQALTSDLRDGSWERRYGWLRDAAELDVGLRLVTAETRNDVAVRSQPI